MATVSLYPIMNIQKSTYPLANIQKAIEHCHLLLIYIVKMVTFYSYVSLPEGKSCITRGLAMGLFQILGAQPGNDMWTNMAWIGW